MNEPIYREVDLELLKEEYFHLQSVIESFDAKSLTIKAWSVSVVGGIAGSGALIDDLRLLVFAALVSLMFWLIDASWKTLQHAHHLRLEDIEEYMRGERENIPNLQITECWRRSYRATQLQRYLKTLFWYHIVLPHGAMFFILLAAYGILHKTS